jgi:hypothetical protein
MLPFRSPDKAELEIAVTAAKIAGSGPQKNQDPAKVVKPRRRP